MTRSAVLGVILLASLSGGCAGGRAPTDDGGDGDVVEPILDVHNQSQFELEQIRMHPDADYLSVRNRLPAEISVREEEIFTIDPFESPSYITVYRRQVANGPLIAITTAEAITVDVGTKTLIVFDDSFRLMDE